MYPGGNCGLRKPYLSNPPPPRPERRPDGVHMAHGSWPCHVTSWAAGPPVIRPPFGISSAVVSFYLLLTSRIPIFAYVTQVGIPTLPTLTYLSHGILQYGAAPPNRPAGAPRVSAWSRVVSAHATRLTGRSQEQDAPRACRVGARASLLLRCFNEERAWAHVSDPKT